MDRFQPISITNSSLGAHLYPSEEVYLLTANVGLYSGPYKSLPHSGGTVYLTSHRLFYIDDAQPHLHSCFLTLNLIRETQFYAGFLKSNPKVTLGFDKVKDEEGNDNAGLRKTPSTKGGAGGADWRVGRTGVQENGTMDDYSKKTWICRICGYSNTIETTNGSSAALETMAKCEMCGVKSDLKDLVVEGGKKEDVDSQQKPALSSPSTSKDGISCPACTFANHPSMARCEICDTALGTVDAAQYRQTDKVNGAGVQTAVEREEREEPVERHDSVRLSFRKGGDKAFYSTMRTTLKAKHWLRTSTAPLVTDGQAARNRFSSAHRNIDGRSASSALEGEDGVVGSMRRVGIEGIFSAVDFQAKEESNDMRDAFQDLEALMTRAKKMVDLAETLNAKLTRQEAAAGKGVGGDGEQANDETANIIRSSLVRLGLPTPAITHDMAKDSMEYHLQLAHELAGLLYSGPSSLMGKGRVVKHSRATAEHGEEDEGMTKEPSGRGMIPLDELWCMWNRARGVALVSPQTLLSVCDIIPSITIPRIDCKRFASGLCVLHTSRYQSLRFSRRVLAYLGKKREEGVDGGAATTLEIAKREECALYLVNELLHEVEYETGLLARDDQGQVSWYENQITDFDWDRWSKQRGTAQHSTCTTTTP